MMREIQGVRQDDPTRVARWFSAAECDLYTWGDAASGEIVRFQFCYDKHRDEHLVEWVAACHGSFDPLLSFPQSRAPAPPERRRSPSFGTPVRIR